jgi:phosphatidylcholine synthase
LLALLSAGVFVPMRWVYPSRTRTLRPLTVALLATWSLAFTWFAVQPQPDPLALRWSLLGPAYYVAVSIALDRRRRLAST